MNAIHYLKTIQDMTSPVFYLHQGRLPVCISIPHAGQSLSDEVKTQLLPIAQFVDDCDWHLEKLYQFAIDAGFSVLRPVYARYVIDLNRPPNNENLYPGQDTTGLIPIDTFNKEPLYLAEQLPDAQEVQRRIECYWQPYHQTLQAELARLKGMFGQVLLWEAHSIRSRVPRFFKDKLPDFNFGTLNGQTAEPGLAEALVSHLQKIGNEYTAIANGRFKGGYITRQYGRPEEGVHAIQLELAQINYMQEERPYSYFDDKAEKVSLVIQQLIEIAMSYCSIEQMPLSASN